MHLSPDVFSSEQAELNLLPHRYRNAAARYRAQDTFQLLEIDFLTQVALVAPRHQGGDQKSNSDVANQVMPDLVLIEAGRPPEEGAACEEQDDQNCREPPISGTVRR
jgi:hypothetical protein